MLNYLKKFAVDIFPSVAATVIGAYIVNHYIVAKPNADAPPAAAASTANPKADGKPEVKADSKTESKPADTTASVSNLPAPGIRAKGVSEKAQGKTEAKNDAKAEARNEAKADEKADSKSAEAKPAESKPEKIRVILPSPIQPVQSAVAPVAPAAPAGPVAVTAPVAPVESAAAAPEERRDANELARAAIERLRANGDTASRAPEAAGTHEPRKEAQPREAQKEAQPKEAPKVATAPVGQHAPAVAPASPAPALRPLPPPIMISGPPAAEPFGHVPPPRPPYAEAADPNRPVPPADIPASRPLDLRADMAEPSVRDRAASAAEDALSNVKSIFHAVLPK